MNIQSIFALLALSILSIFLVSSASALIVSSVDSDVIAPGQEGNVDITLKNNLGYDLDEVSFALDFSSATLPLSPKGSSEETIDSISEDDKETVTFTLRAESDAKVGDYKIPYTITYTSENSTIVKKSGTIAVRISASPNLDFSVSTTNPIIGQKGKITLKLLNKGLGEAKFISVKISPEGYTLLSEDQSFISSIDSNDFDSVSFDVIFKSKSASLTGYLEYRDVDNKLLTKNLDLPLTVYTQKQAIDQGIIAKNNSFTYILTIIVIHVIWFVWRSIRKRNRLRKSREAIQNGGK